jgi:gliding motility-associated-like protein
MFSQGNTCAQATPFCLNPGASFSFPNVHNGSTATGATSYGCVTSRPDPSWFYLKTTAAGPLTFTVSQGTAVGQQNIDVDYVVWGPYTAATFSAACSNLTAGKIVSCSFSTAGVETINFTATAAGQYYMILITNYSGVSGNYTNGSACPGVGGCPGYVNIVADPGNSATDCSITCPGGTNHNAITLLMQDSANVANGTATYVASGSTLGCNKGYYVIKPSMPATLSDPATDILTPCLMIDYNPFQTNLDTKGGVTVNEAGNPYWSFCPSTCGQTVSGGTGTTGSDFQEYLLDVDPSQIHDAVFCKVIAAGTLGTTTVTLKNCWDNTIVAGPQSWSGAAGTTACFTLTVPANTALGSESYSITPAAGVSGLYDTNWGDAVIDPNLMAAGTYTITYHFNGPAACVQATGTFVITVPTKPTVVVTPSSTAICTGASITLTASGANAYVWSPGGTTGTTLGVSPTNTASPTSYTVVGTNTTTACTNSVVATVTVNPLPTISISASPSPSVCLGSSSSFTASGANTYTWTSSANGGLSGASGSNVSGTPTSTTNATYTVNATDANGCKNSKTLTINVNPLPTLTLTASSNSVCTSASATLTASGANTYTWSSSAGGGLSATTGSLVTASPTSTPATYTVVGTNSTTGCQSANKTTSITITATPTVNIAQSTYTTCLNVPATFTASGSGTYTWTPTTGMTGSNSANPVVTPTSTATTVYSVSGSSGGCTSSAATVTLTVNPLPNISVVPTSTAICSGGGSSTLTASGATTYTWNPAGTLSASTGAVVTATPTNTASPTSYTVTGTDANSCVNTGVVSITVNQTPTVSVSGGGGNSQTVCGGGLANTSVAGITFSVIPAGSVSWTNDNTAIGLAVSGNGNIATYPAPTVTVQTTGIITANATATGSGCASTNSTQLTYTITINPIPGETGEVISPASCGVNDGTIIGASGTGGSTYVYSWDGGVTFGATSSYTNGAGTYPLQIKDNATGCIYSQNFTIPNAGAPAPPTVTPSATAACVGSTVTLSAPAVAGTTYNWTEANGNTGTGNTYTVTNMPASPNPYTIGVTATASGCTGVAGTTSITVNPLPTPSISNSTSQICQGSSTTLSVTPTGAYSYQWGNSGGIIVGATSNTLSVSASDTYSVTVTDNITNCSASTSANGTITINSLPVIDATNAVVTQSSCTVATGSINNVTITGSATLTYTWTSGTALPTGVVVSNGTGGTASLSNAAAGVYCLNVTDGNSCVNSYCSISITNAGAPAQPVLTASGNDTTFCNGIAPQTLTVSVTASGSVTPSVNWYADAALTNTLSINSTTYAPPSNLPVGTTTVYVTATDNGCASTGKPITITILPTPTINITPLGSNSVICNGSSVVITPTGATTYTLNPGNIPGTSFTVSPTTTTTYTISGSDGTSAACSNLSSDVGLASITVSATPTISVSPLGSNSVICNGSSVVITPTGATTYTLNPGNLTGTSFTVNPVLTTTYTIDGSNGGGTCTNLSADQGITIITVNPTPTVDVSGTSLDSATCGQANGGVTGINVVGGTPNFTYQWYDANGAISGATSLNLSNVSTGNYTLQAIDANGCIATEAGGVPTFSVPASTAVHAQFTTNPNPAIGSVPLAVSFTNTSNGASNYIWVFGDGNGSLSVNASNTYTNTGTYTVTLIAINGACRDTARAIVVADISTTLIIPNVFSPNGDGTNDQFFINNTGMSSLNCDIFNRWGQLLFSITAPDQAWDGKTPNGLAAPEGTYMYMLQALGLDGKTYKQQGTVTLVR